MTVALRILATLAKGPGDSIAVHERMTGAHLKTVQHGLSCLNSQGLVDGKRFPGSPSKYWSITETGLAELRRAGMGVETPSAFGSFGSRIGRVPSVFELARVA